MNHHASKLKGLIWLILAAGIGAAFALGLSPLARAVPWEWEEKLAVALDMNSAKECPANSQAQALLERLVKRLYPLEPQDAAFSVKVQVVQVSAVNAYAMLGGKIFINSGLLKQAESPEEVAGVLAHEIEHVRRRHVLEGAMAHLFTSAGINAVFGGGGWSEWTNYFLSMDFTRAQEAQADEGGLHRLQDAHVDNRGFRHFFQRMGESELAPLFLSDHPSNDTRIAMVERFVNRDVTPIMTQDEWGMLKRYCGAE